MDLQSLIVPAAVVAGFIVIKRLIGGPKVASNTVKEKILAGAKLVDVRTSEEYREGSYPGAVNIPVNDLARRMGELPKDKSIVVFCASGARSASAARALKQAGFADVVNAGGLSDMPG